LFEKSRHDCVGRDVARGTRPVLNDELLPCSFGQPLTNQSRMAQNEAFVLSDPEPRRVYAGAFAASSALYYRDKPTFEQVLGEIGTWADPL
jgi:hypothetical protein